MSIDHPNNWGEMKCLKVEIYFKTTVSLHASVAQDRVHGLTLLSLDYKDYIILLL